MAGVLAMRIVIVSDFGEVKGGATKVAVTSARGLADAGVPVNFVCAVSPVSAMLSHPRITVHCLGLGNVWERANPLAAAMQGIWNGKARRELEKILDDIAGDETVVHFHQWTKALSPSVLMAPLKRELPSVASLHDYFLACPNGAYYRYPEGVPCQLAPLSRPCITAHCDRNSRAHKVVRILRQYATRHATARAGASLAVLSVSSFAKRVMDGFLPTAHPRFVVQSPVPVVKATPADVARNAPFAFVGRLTEEKGVRLLADVAMESGLPLAITGDGPLRAALSRLGGQIRCTGWLDDAAVLTAMRQARALVFPSAWYETGGLVVLEALAQGVPVIVARDTAAADYVVDGENGYVVNAKDRTALKERMLSLMDDARAARMGAEAYRRYWSEPRTLETHTGNLLSVYRSILSAHHASTT
jgi:glycosyltransferase involved in cell wall biosynthesis